MADTEKEIVSSEAVLDPSTRLESPRSRSRDGMFGALLILWVASFFVGLVGVVVWRGYREVVPQMREADRPSIAELKALPQTAAAPVAPAKEEPAAETPATGGDTAAAPSVSKADLAVRVLNGGAAKGTAAVVTDLLKKAGFTKAEAGNATGDYTGVTVYCSEGKTAEADALAEALKQSYQEIAKKTIPKDVAELSQRTCTVVVGAGAR